MDNICIPQPTHYKIKYRKSTGEMTERTIVPTRVTDDAITGYCYSAHDIRTFKKAQIESMTTVLNVD